MNYKKLGNTDLDVSTICLGTMTWGEQNTQDEGFEQMDYALEQGVNFWDTAEIYAIPAKKKTYGRTEEIIGNWFKSRNKRDEVILATKISGSGLSWIRGGGNQFDKKNLNEAVNKSLERLKTDYIDLYQLHWPERKSNYFGRLGYDHKDEDDWNDFNEILESLSEIIKSGKIRYVGLSNETSWGLSKFLEISKNKNLPRMMSVQNPYSLLNRTYEIGLAEISVRERSGLLAYSPLARGLLTGKYIGNNIPKGSRLSRDDKIKKIVNQRSDLAVKSYFQLAKKYNLDPVHMALAFCNERPFMGSVIFGATNILQLKRILKGVELKLNSEINNEINILNKKFPLTF